MTDAAAIPAQAQTPPPPTTLVTARLVLRPLQVEDAEDLFPVFNDPESMRYWSHLPHKDVAETRAKLERVVEEDGTSRTWAVTRDGGRCQGWVSLFGAQDRLVWLGYILLPETRGQGLATEAVHAALDFAFGPWDMHRVEANLDPRNARSERLLKRLGFTREGVRREDFLLGGRYYDTLIYGLLAAEWRSARAAA
ncbi:GNAT family N-acetyltransferase [Aerophototrophica crusticola]|uniref:GNAT family N-acetyltransferase n=1 Tax=Aerophototrophica crusticola TaxID=1709002 RepID=A0A858R402_9PROT|nr:GNAT family N-acetyltransferase [Rhodospirillaceae bacterium B3]